MIVGGIVLNRGWWSTMVLAPPHAVPVEVSTSIPEGVPPESSGAPSIMPEAEFGLAPEEPTGFLGRPGPAQRAENRQRMMTETAEDIAKYGSVAATLLFGNPVSKLYAVLVLIGVEDPLWEGQ